MKKAGIIFLLLFFRSISIYGQSTTDSAYIKGAACEQLQQFRKAYYYYNEWLSNDSLNTEALNATARTALQLGRIKEAESLYAKSLGVDSSNYYAGLQLAKLYFQLKDYEKSFDYYQWLLERDSTNISFLQGAGDCAANMDFYPVAMQFYYAAAELNKENVALAVKLINTLISLQQADTSFLNMAMEICDTALVYNPAHHDLEQAKGVIYFIRSDYPAADSVLSRLVASGDSSALSLRYLSLAKYRQDLYDEAIPYFDKLYQLDPYNRETIMLLASCLGQTDNGDKALPLFDRAEKLMYPTEEEKYNLSLMRANTYEKKGDKQNAQKYYWDAYKLSSKNKTAMLTRLVWLCYFSRKDFETFLKEEYEQTLLYNVLLIRELSNRKTLGSRQEMAMMFSKSALNIYIEDLFFKDVEKVRMRSPDGEISWVTRDELTQLVKVVLP